VTRKFQVILNLDLGPEPGLCQSEAKERRDSGVRAPPGASATRTAGNDVVAVTRRARVVCTVIAQ
jgi:hypothetical protein